MTETIGVLLMAYGGPDSLDDIPEYLLDIRHGRATSPELIAEITENYRQIGGKSPLLNLTRQQAAAVEAKLNADAPPGVHYKTYIGMRHWTPRIVQAVDEMIADGIRQAVALVLAPHYSSMSIAKYFQLLDEALAGRPDAFRYAPITSYHDHPLYIQALAERVQRGLAEMPADTLVIFSAHSLPVRILAEGDPYDAQLRESAALIAQAAGLPDARWRFSYQSAGRSPEPWLGPQLQDFVLDLAQQGHRNLLSVPIGFVSDHVEILFDIDIQARQVAEEAGVRLERVPSLNDDPLYVAALADLVGRRYEEEFV
ncbi:MAG: ferrochelatase [Chloroflexi bacterium]|nr:ferrochelatase [Chloroflexota bacterium]